jgi:hypothetical protein
MAKLILTFTHLEFSADACQEVESALTADRAVWATWNVKVRRSGGTTDNIDRLRITSANLVECRVDLSAGRFATSAPDIQSLQLLFKVEIGGVVLDDTLERDVDSPFPNRDETSPSSRAGAPAFHLAWSLVNVDALGSTQRTGDSVVDHEQPAAVQASWGAVRQGLATIETPQPAHTCWSAATPPPFLADSLVIEHQEFSPPVSDFRNWASSGWIPGGVFHQQRRNTFCRAKSAVNALVLHETAAWGRLDRGWPGSTAWLNGYARHPAAGHPSSISDGKEQLTPCNHAGPQHLAEIAAHFCVHTDGSIAQHYDAVQKLAHGGPHNDHSIGIELTNVVWVGSGDVDAANTVELQGMLAAGAHWETVSSWGARDRYVVPSREVLESLYGLVAALMFHFDIPPIWRQTTTNQGPDLFLMNRSQAELSGPEPGIYAHFNFTDPGGHTDGSFQTLYTWLRHERGFCSLHARQEAMQLCDAYPHGRWRNVGGRRFLEIAGIAHTKTSACPVDAA